MQLTLYADVDELLGGLLNRMQQILNRKLIGLYLYGSLVTGDFDRETSDIDLLAVASSEINDEEFERLRKMHDDFVAENRKWGDRIEIAYLSATALRTFKTQTSRIAVISPGEPFHFKEAGNDWLINWRVARENGVALFGPAPTTIIEPISKQEFLKAVCEQAKDWGEWVYQMRNRPAQAYAILTMCRALYAYKNGEQVSKKQAARWAQECYPQWSSLIQNALAWRAAWRDEAAKHEATLPETVRFVHFAIEQIAENRLG